VSNPLKLSFAFLILSSMLPAAGQSITTAAIEVEESTPMIVKISGAPGDGNTALAVAIRNELARIGLPTSDKTHRPKYRLDVYVTVGKAQEDGKQPIEVEWWLHNSEGKYQGTVMQRVELPNGELNGRWENDAIYAARGAAQGILRLLPQ
jgi:hypothetical protein